VYPYIIERLNQRSMAYIHVADSNGGDWHAKLYPIYQGVYFAGGGFTKESGAALLERGGADAIVYGTKLLANPDLSERFRRNAPLNEPDQSTFYVLGEHGYTDYPTLDGTLSAPI
jgi:N-ethylmaleimide reductase